MKMYHRVINDKLHLPNYRNDLSKDLLIKMLERNVDSRLGHVCVDQVKNHSYFKAVDWIKVYNQEYDVPLKPKIVFFINFRIKYLIVKTLMKSSLQ